MGNNRSTANAMTIARLVGFRLYFKRYQPANNFVQLLVLFRISLGVKRAPSCQGSLRGSWRLDGGWWVGGIFRTKNHEADNSDIILLRQKFEKKSCHTERTSTQHSNRKHSDWLIIITMSGPNAPLYAKRSLRVINAESDVSDDCVEEEFCDASKCVRYNIMYASS